MTTLKKIPLHFNGFVSSIDGVVIKLNIVSYLHENLSTWNFVVFFTIIQLNRSIVHDIEHFISKGNSFMVCMYMYTHIYIYIYIYIYIAWWFFLEFWDWNTKVWRKSAIIDFVHKIWRCYSHLYLLNMTVLKEVLSETAKSFELCTNVYLMYLCEMIRAK